MRYKKDMVAGAEITTKHFSVAGARGGMKWHCPMEGVYTLEVPGGSRLQFLSSNRIAQEDAPRPSAQTNGDYRC